MTKLSIEKLNGENFSALMEDVVRLDADKMIENLKVMGTLVADAFTAERVNDILVKDVVVGSGQDLQITGNLTIRSNVSVLSNVKVVETLNRINLSQIITSADIHGNQLLFFSLCFNSIINSWQISLDSIVFAENTTVSYTSVEGYLNGVNASEVLNNAIINQTIDALLDRVHFDDLVIEGDLEIKSGLVNDVNISSLNASTLRLNADQIVEGSIIFEQVCPSGFSYEDNIIY